MTLFELIEEWRIAADEWADQKDAAELLRGTKNDVLAEITAEQVNCKSHAAAERQARLSARWKAHRALMLEAERKERRAKIALTLLDKKFEAMRTENANARSELYKYS